METITRTIYLSHLTNCLLMRRPFSVLPNSTLNQKFTLFKDELPSINEYPVLGYIGIGNKGATYEMTDSNYVLTDPVRHLPRDASLYNFIPFLIRDINNDISSTERMKYRLRVPVSIKGVTYVAYYLRALNISDLIPSVELRNVNNEIITTNSFTPTQSDLSPNHPQVSNSNVNDANGDYLVSTSKVNFQLNQTDIQEIMDACNIMFGDPRYAVINEIAIVSGIDKILQGTFGSTTSNYTEVIAAQCATFISQYHALTSNTTKVEIELDAGSVEPLNVN
jgi:hypothetical protein